MAEPPVTFHGVAVDVGNSAIHVAFYDHAREAPPRPDNILHLLDAQDDLGALQKWANRFLPAPTPWCIASVNDRAAAELLQWLQATLPAHPIRRITHEDCPVPIRVAHPERVGVDRLMAVVAAARLCGDRPAIVIDAGTAITVDLWADGAFQGGAILPGIRMSAAALDRYTEKLPLVETVGMDPPDVIGRSTPCAMKAGIFWGTVGAVRELSSRMATGIAATPRIFITGGDGGALVAHIAEAEYVPDMVLAGIALTAAQERGDV